MVDKRSVGTSTMVTTTLLAEAVLSVLITVVIAVVGTRILERDVSDASRRANRAFATWWFALAAVFLIEGLWDAVAALGAAGDPLVLAFALGLTYVYYLALAVAAWSLLVYLAFLLTGRRSFFVPLTAFYAVYAVALLAFVHQLHPASLDWGPWYAWVSFSRSAASLPVNVLVFLLLVPQIGGSLTYALLALRLRDPLLRYRAGLVGVSLTVWLGLVYLARFLSFGGATWWNAGGHLVGLLAAVLVYLGFFPPSGIRRRLTEPRRVPGRRS